MSQYSVLMEASTLIPNSVEVALQDLDARVSAVAARLTALEAAQKPAEPPATTQREPGWYPFFDAAGECTTYYWRTGCWFPFKNSRHPAKLIPVGHIGPRIQEPGE